MSWKKELLASPAETRDGVDSMMNKFSNISEFEYSVEAGTVGKRPIIPVWYINVVRKGDDLNNPSKWVHAYRIRRDDSDGAVSTHDAS